MSADPLRDLQAAARVIAEHVNPGHPACRVIVLDRDGVKVLDTTVPLCGCATPTAVPSVEVPVQSGWIVTDRGAQFDGQPVRVPSSRLKLLRALIDATEPVTAKELTVLVFDRETDIANTRYHIRELRKELKAAFTFDSDVIQGDDDGYRLVLR